MLFWGSAVLYICIFSVATVFFYFSSISKNKYNKYLLALVGILVLSFFAASRSDEIGKDIQGYVLPAFEIAKSSTSFNNFLDLGRLFSDTTTANSKELSYLALVYFSSRFANNDWLLLFLLQFLTVMPVYLAAEQFSKKFKISVPFFMLLYMFLFYLNSFNVMRQSMACAFFLLGYSYQGTSRVKMFLSYLIAILFHRMAFLAIALLLVGKLFARLRGYKKVLGLFIIALLFLNLKTIITFLSNKGFLTPAQVYYADVFIFNSVATTWTNVATILLIADGVRRTIMTLPYFSIGSTETYMFELKNIVLVGYMFYMVFMIMTRSVYGGRVSLYTDFFWLPLWAYFCKKKFLPSWIGYCISLAIIIVFWLFWDLNVNGYGAFAFRF